MQVISRNLVSYRCVWLGKYIGLLLIGPVTYIIVNNHFYTPIDTIAHKWSYSLKSFHETLATKGFSPYLLPLKFIQKRFAIKFLIVHLFRVEIEERFIHLTVWSNLFVTVSSDQPVRRLRFLVRCCDDRRRRRRQFWSPNWGWRSLWRASRSVRTESVVLDQLAGRCETLRKHNRQMSFVTHDQKRTICFEVTAAT